ncbi:MAG: Nif3-like dinuclear metal center hexameric protein [Bacteroidales bacterium]|nr:Nif3-like dinuclear metal center hexameric protein [Bacteroidales bacterium]
MKLKSIIQAIEQRVPLSYQEDYDNSGLQVGFPDAEVRSVLVCLDVTEEVLEEAARLGCQLVVSHHPLLFHSLKQVSDATYQQRCVVAALNHGIAVYSSHTCLDNAPGGVNHRMAEMLGLHDTDWLESAADGKSGSGLIGFLPRKMEAMEFFNLLKTTFQVPDLRYSAGSEGHMVEKIALCGGAGAFLMRKAMEKGADCFVTGEMHYHDWFESGPMLLAELDHYHSEHHAAGLLRDIIHDSCPELELIVSQTVTDPVKHL